MAQAKLGPRGVNERQMPEPTLEPSPSTACVAEPGSIISNMFPPDVRGCVGLAFAAYRRTTLRPSGSFGKVSVICLMVRRFASCKQTRSDDRHLLGVVPALEQP